MASDVALHGFTYLGVLLTFVAILGFLLLAFTDIPDPAQPFVELGIALIFFAWAWVLRSLSRRERGTSNLRFPVANALRGTSGSGRDAPPGPGPTRPGRAWRG